MTTANPTLANKPHPHTYQNHSSVQQAKQQPISNRGDFSIAIPIAFKKGRRHKTILVNPDENPLANPTTRPTPPNSVDRILLQALVKADRWQRQLAARQYSSLRELVREQNLNYNHTCDLFQLNFLAPKLKEAILNGTQPRHLKLIDLMKGVPLLWEEQEAVFWDSATQQTLKAPKK